MGNWSGVMLKLANLDPMIKRAARSSQYVLGRDIISRVKGHLKNQDLGWKKLAKSTIKRKGHSIALLEYGTYYENIRLWQKDLLVNVGVPQGVKEKNNTETALMAAFHEYGAKGVPKRPLWNPTFREMGGSEGIRVRLVRGIKNYLEDRGYNIRWQ